MCKIATKTLLKVKQVEITLFCIVTGFAVAEKSDTTNVLTKISFGVTKCPSFQTLQMY